MISRPLAIPGARALRHPLYADDRGTFSRVLCVESLGFTAAQASVSRNPKKGTLRGLHAQHGEAKLVTCLSGVVYDVIVDLRPGAARRWEAVKLGDGIDGVLIPEGCAHGFLTLTDDVVLLYHCSTPYDPAQAHGVRWDDPELGIPWPSAPKIISSRDQSLPGIGAR